MTTNLVLLIAALGVHESGNNDLARGAAGEVSRYQIMPKIWKGYTHSRDWRNPQVSMMVAGGIWLDRMNHFRKKTHREPTPKEAWVLWNAPGMFERRKWQYDRMPKLIKLRAERFARAYREQLDKQSK